MDQEALTKITQAKTRLIANHPFYAHIALSTPMIENNEPGMRMATDMQNIYYSVEFVKEHSINELAGVICHEVLHIAFMHGLRKGTKDHMLWNVACDFAINHIVLDSGLKLPTDCLYDEKYKDMTAEKIYEDIVKNAKTITISWGGFTPPKGAGGKSLSPAQKAELEAEIKIKVSEAANAAKARGKLPGSLQGLIEAVGKSKIDWKDYIQQWVSGTTPDNYTWNRPNRSFLVNHRVFMPRMQLNGAGNGILSVDTSGSVSDQELTTDVTEVTGIIELCTPDSLKIIQHDSVIHSVTDWEAGEEFRSLKITGRGGTCIRPTFEWIKNYDGPIDWIIIFSDMEIFDWPPPSEWPDVPVLLASTGAKDTSPAGCNATYINIRDPMDGV